jgi:hypothetical protein
MQVLLLPDALRREWQRHTKKIRWLFKSQCACGRFEIQIHAFKGRAQTFCNKRQSMNRSCDDCRGDGEVSRMPKVR